MDLFTRHEVYDPQVFWHSSQGMTELADKSAQLVFASPPYTNNPDKASLDKSEYMDFIHDVYTDIYRVLAPDGVLVSMNTELKDHAHYNKGNRLYDGQVWFKSQAIKEVAQSIGFTCFDNKIWVKTLEEDRFRFTYSQILFYSKKKKGIKRPHGLRHAEGFGPSVWYFKDSMQRRDSSKRLFRDAIHPDIPALCMDEFTAKGDLVIAPFAGSGTVLAAAYDKGRRSAGYEIDKSLDKMISETIYGPRPKIFSRCRYLQD